jgi:hypothetical protein
MTIFKKEPMVTNQVHTTSDYSLFKTLEGNRVLNPLHFSRLKKSIEQNYLLTVIIVNENYEIIDGQHRFNVIKELGFPLNYIVCKGYGLNEVHILNATSKTWNADDYLEGYCKLNYSHYLKYKEFKDIYGFGHNECMTILSGLTTRVNSDIIKQFHQGKFKIKDFEKSCEIADKIKYLGKFYTEYKGSIFVLTMLKLFNNKNFEFTEFIQKLKLQPLALQKCVSVDQMLMLIEEIYNYRRREKVNLRF